ncbi:MAG: tetratricopeptide repeat protein [Phycisphaerae bacterium]
MTTASRLTDNRFLWSTGRWAPVVVATTLLFTGCRGQDHETAKVTADQRWVEVRADLKLDMAEKAFEEHRYEDAAMNAAETLALAPGKHSAYAIMVRSYLEMQDLERTKEALATADAAAVDYPEMTYLRGVYLEMRGRYEEALTCFADARSRVPEDADYMVAQVEMLMQLDRAAPALRIINEFLARADETDSLTTMAGIVAEAAGDHQQAIRWYHKACLAHSDQRWIHERLAAILIQQGRHDQAIHWLTPFYSRIMPQRNSSSTSAPISEDDVKLMSLMVKAKLGAGLEREALDIQRKIVHLAPENLNHRLLQIQIAMRTGAYDAALEASRNALYHFPDHGELQLMAATTLRKMGRLQEAKERIETVLARSAADTDAHCLLAEILAEQGRNEEARTSFQKALDSDPQCHWAQVGLKRLTSS